MLLLPTHNGVFSASGVYGLYNPSKSSLFSSEVGEVGTVKIFLRSCSRMTRRMTGGGNVVGGCNGDCGVTMESFLRITVVVLSSKFTGDSAN